MYPIATTTNDDPPSSMMMMMDDIMGCRDLLVDEEELSASSNQEASIVFEQWLSDSTASTTSASDGKLDSSDDDVALMEIDEQIGSTLLSDDVFGTGAAGGGGGCGGVDDAFANYCIPPLATSSNLDDGLDLDLNLCLDVNTATTTTSSTMLPTLVEFKFESHNDIDDVFLQDPLPASTLSTPPPAPPSPLLDDVRYQQVLKKLEASMRRSRETRKSLIMKTNKTVKYGRKKSISGVLSSVESSSRRLQRTILLNSVHACSA